MGGGRKTPSHNSYRLLLSKILSSLSPYLPVEKVQKGDPHCEPNIGEQQGSTQVSFTPDEKMRYSWAGERGRGDAWILTRDPGRLFF